MRRSCYLDSYRLPLAFPLGQYNFASRLHIHRAQPWRPQAPFQAAAMAQQQQQRPLLRSAALNTTLPSGALRVAEKQQQGLQREPENGRLSDMQQEVERRRQRREAEAAEKAARLREKRLQAASKAGAAEPASSWDPSGGWAAAPSKAHSRLGASVGRAGSVEPSSRPGAASGKPTASSLSTDGSRPRAERERLSISSKPSAPASVPDPAPPAQPAGSWAQAQSAVQMAEEQDQQEALEASVGAALEPVASVGEDAAAGPATLPQRPSAPAASSGSSRATGQCTSMAASVLQHQQQQHQAPPPSRTAAPTAASTRPAPEEPRARPQRGLSSAQRIPAGPVGVSRNAGAGGAPAHQPAPAAPATTAAAAVAPEMSGAEQAELEERHAELVLGHCSTLCLKWVNATLDAMLAGPAYEGQALPASQLPVHSTPTPGGRQEALRQLEAALVLHLRNLKLQQAENERDRTCVANELAAGPAGLSEERRSELEDCLALLTACQRDLLRVRSVLGHWLQQAREEVAALVAADQLG